MEPGSDCQGSSNRIEAASGAQKSLFAEQENRERREATGSKVTNFAGTGSFAIPGSASAGPFVPEWARVCRVLSQAQRHYPLEVPCCQVKSWRKWPSVTTGKKTLRSPRQPEGEFRFPLLYCDALSQVPRLIHITASRHRRIVGYELQRYGGQNRRQQRIGLG